MKTIQQITKTYLEWAPMSLTIREVTRINALRVLNQSNKIFDAARVLDIGCGDGKWWTHVMPEGLDRIHGIDISKKEIALANSIISSQCLDVSADNFLDEIKFKKFDLIIGNCSLEHVYYIDKALKNIYALLDEDGVFILLVPTPHWALKGKSIQFLHSLSPRLSMSFSGLINGFFQHWHLYNYNIWKSILTNFNFKIDNVYGLGNGQSEFMFRLGLPTAFISFLVKVLTGKYLNYFLGFITPPVLRNWISHKICYHLDQELLGPQSPNVFEYMIVCRK